jgi:beta-glucosidase
MTDYAPRKGLSAQEIEALIDQVLAETTLEEKVGMMSGRGFFQAFQEDGRWGGRPYRAGGGVERLGLEPFYFTDGPRGVARGHSTCFPCTMARGASFDVNLEQRIGEVMGLEARAQGCTLSGAVCINLLRHPAWGRAQETYGEDSFHLGAMGTALGLGIQTHNVCATVKHLALNSMENARFKVSVEVDERSLHEIYLPHFKAALDAGVASVMSAYNKMNGTYCGENAELLTAILREEWGFDGFVHSDWVKGVYTVDGATAGLDVENPEPLIWGKHLTEAVKSGRVDLATIDQACRRILRIWYRFKCAADPVPEYTADMVASPAHVSLALEAAEKSAVLLENNGTLPLNKSKLKTVAVLGRLAALENTGDFGSSRVQPPYVVTPLEGLRRALGEHAIITGDESDLVAARAAADAADAIVILAGYTAKEEGEYIPGDISLGQTEAPVGGPRMAIGGDRDDLNLPADQIALIHAAAASGKPVIVVIVAGSAVLVESWRESAAAILQTFYSGMEGGTALARLLLGDVSPSAKLPFTVARDAAHYPFFNKDAERIRYDYWHGYAKFDHERLAPRYAFGHGLSYTRFDYTGVSARRAGDALVASVTVRNTGAVAATEVVQVYIGAPGLAAQRHPKSLKGFARVALQPGEARDVAVRIALADLRWRDPATHSWQLEPGHYRVFAGGASDRLIETAITLPG